MNYDSITGLPLEASFLAYSEYSCEHQDSYPFYILAVKFPVLNDKSFLAGENNKDYLLTSAVQKLIRNHPYMKTAFRDASDDSLIIFVDETLMANQDINDELQKAFMCFTSYCWGSFNNTTIYIHAGIYHITNKNANIKNAIKNAKLSLNKIPEKDPTSFVFYKETTNDMSKLANKIIPAIEDNWKNNHLLIYLQPKFDLRNGKMSGAEALVRIMDTDGHIMKPGFFLPVVKENNMSCEMDLMITEKILRLLSSWDKAGISPLPVSVNLSENTLYDPLFIGIFNELMDKYHDVQRYLRIEISEHSYLRNPYHISQMIDMFHSFGCMVELDDFGKNSMTYTKETMPHVDFVKLSSAYWSMAMENSEEEQLFDEYVDLLNNNSIACISECVEQENELDFLKQHRINFAQGFYFSRPVPFDIFQKKYLAYTFINA